jgi:hypothetical protein
MNRFYIFGILIFIISKTSLATPTLQDSIHQRLEKLTEFTQNVARAKSESNKLESLEKLISQEFPFYSIEDIKFYANKINIYGLSKFELQANEVILFDDERKKLKSSNKIDFSQIMDSILIVDGQIYDIDFSRGLKWNYENKLLPILKKDSQAQYNSFEKFLNIVPNAEAQACTQEQIGPRTNMAIAGASLVGYCIDPRGMLIKLGIASCKGIAEYCRSKSFKNAGKTFCNNLPIVDEIKTLHNKGQ